MTDMREKVARAMRLADMEHRGWDMAEAEAIVAADKPTLAELRHAQAAITALWPLAMEEAAKVAEAAMRVHAMDVVLGRGMTDAGNPAAAIRNRKVPL
jgi:hypothetical protein